MDWKEVDEARYDEMLGILPPAYWDGKGFLVGEPFDHRTCKISGYTTPTFAAFVSHKGKYYEGPNMTVAEFRAFDLKDLPS